LAMIFPLENLSSFVYPLSRCTYSRFTTDKYRAQCLGSHSAILPSSFQSCVICRMQ
jgi:hypothetical protein